MLSSAMASIGAGMMIDKKRIEEAEKNVKMYLEEGMLKKTLTNQSIMKIFLANAKESLKVAEEIYNNKTSDLWVIVCSYYSMFYYANAILLKLGYKVGDKVVHKVTSDAIIVYVRDKLKTNLIKQYEEAKEEAEILAGIKADSLIENFEFERNKRSIIQYETSLSQKESKAKTSLERAREFAKVIKQLLDIE